MSVRGDRIPEPSETLWVRLSASVGASIVDGNGYALIVDNH